MFMRSVVAAALFILSSAIGYAETIYVWIDASGVKHFSEICPAGMKCRVREVSARRASKLLYSTPDSATDGTTDTVTTSTAGDTSTSSTASGGTVGSGTTSTASDTSTSSTTTDSGTSSGTGVSTGGTPTASTSGTSQTYVTGYVTDSGVLAPPSTGTYAYNAFKPGSAGFPAVGGTYTDPVLGGTVKRLTNIGASGNAEDIYAKHQANANGTLAFHRSSTGVHIVNVNSGAVVYPSQPTGLAAHEMHWDALDPDKYYYFSGANLVRRNLATQTNTTLKTFPATLQNNGGSLNIQSRDGRYFTVRYGGTNKVWDRQLDFIYAGAVTPASSTGWTSITPDGNYLVTASNAQSSYRIDHTTRTISGTATMFWSLCGDHGALISASNGKSYMITFNCNNIPAVYRVDITLNQAGRTPSQQAAANQVLVPLTWNDAGHFSAVSRGPLADWVFVAPESVIDSFDSSTADWTAYKQEILAVNVLTLEIRRLAHHRSRSVTASYGYMPRVSTSWDGSVVMWTSNYNTNSPGGYSDMYAIQYPLGASW